MKYYSVITLSAIVLIACSSIHAQPTPDPKHIRHEIYKIERPVVPETFVSSPATIQVAILLDVSNSMDGLIAQAKAQLWNMVSVLGKATCNGVAPSIEIALYEYGRQSNNPKDGYVKQISPFTTDLDVLSKQLFNLTTNGGDEYCGQVIFTAVSELRWSTSANSYKVIFIAGNEDFLQGHLVYTKACDLAKTKGVIVNTIFCGDKMEGIREHWNLGSECGNGSYTNINANAAIEEYNTPYDSAIYSANTKLNRTYIAYGYSGAKGKVNQEAMDVANGSMSGSVALKRISVKANKQLYKSASWDLVDKVNEDSTYISKLDVKTLPDEYKNKTKKEIELAIKTKSKERSQLQSQIESLNAKREAFIVNEKKKKATVKGTATLETEIEKILKVQANRFKILIK